MNRKKGTLRIAMVLTPLVISFGFLVIVIGDKEVGISIVFGPVFVWFIYFGFWFVLRGFESKVCENCEKTWGS